MFLLLLLLLLAGAAVHSYRLEPRTRAAVGEIFLRWILAGYCGLPMVAVAIGILAAPERLGEMLPVGPPSPVLAFFGWAYLGMALSGLLALRYGGTYLIGPAVCWAVYFLGATLVHLHGPAAASHLSHGGILATLATHGGISLILLVALAAARLGRS